MRCADNVYSRHEILHMEHQVLSALKWKLCAATPLQFVDVFCKNGLLTSEHTGEHLHPDVSQALRSRLSALSFICLRNYEFNQYRPSVIATSIAGAARIMLDLDPMWSISKSCRVFCAQNEVAECANLLVARYKAMYAVSDSASNQPSPVSVMEQRAAVMNNA